MRNISLWLAAVGLWSLAGVSQAGSVLNTDYSFPAKIYDNCSHEMVDLNVDAHARINATLDGAGGVHFNVGWNAHMDGQGVASDAKYVGNARLAFKGNLGSGVFGPEKNEHAVVRAAISAQLNRTGSGGAADDEVLKGEFKVTFNAQGEPVNFDIDWSGIECKK